MFTNASSKQYGTLLYSSSCVNGVQRISEDNKHSETELYFKLFINKWDVEWKLQSKGPVSFFLDMLFANICFGCQVEIAECKHDSVFQQQNKNIHTSKWNYKSETKRKDKTMHAKVVHFRIFFLITDTFLIAIQ